MPSTVVSRSISALAIPMVGIAAFAIGLLTSPGRATDLRVHAQDECSQPSATGCPLEISVVVQAVLDSGMSTHNWLLSVTGFPDFAVSLIGLPGNYSLAVFMPDGSLAGTSNNPGLQDEFVGLAGAADGTYRIVVSSPNGDASLNPYTLFANPTGTAETPVPFDTYAPPPRAFNSYR
jgi:hypothetical protein